VLGDLAGYNKLIKGKHLVEILCPPTYSPSLIKTGQQLFDIESGNPHLGQFKGHNLGVPGEFGWL